MSEESKRWQISEIFKKRIRRILESAGVDESVIQAVEMTINEARKESLR